MQVGDIVRYKGTRKHIKSVGIITSIRDRACDVLWACGKHQSHNRKFLKLLKEDVCK